MHCAVRVTFVGIALSGALTAQPPSLSLDLVCRLALQNSPSLREGESKLPESRFKVDEAYTLAAPTLNLQAGANRITPPVEAGFAGQPIVITPEYNYNTAVSLRQSLFTFGRLYWAAASSELSEKATQADLQNQRLRVLEEASLAYYETLVSRDQVQIAVDQLKASDARLQEARSLVKAGSAAPVDVKRNEAAQASSEQMRNGYKPPEIAQSEARLRAARADLEQMETGATDPEMEAARALMESARQRAQMLQEGYRREEVDSAWSQWQGATTNLKVTQIDFERFQRLHKEGAISDQQLEARQNALAQARTNYKVAADNYQRLRSGPRPQERQAAWQDYRNAAARYQDLAQGNRPELIEHSQATVQERAQQLQLMREGPRREEIENAKHQWEEARAALDAAQIQYSKGELICPMDAQVSLRNLEPGEAVTPGAPVLTLSDLQRPWVSLYVPEYERPRVHLGQPGSIRADGLKQPVTGSLTRIYEKAEFTPKFIQTPRERVNLVYRAKLSFDNPDLTLYPGQPVDVELQP